MNTGKRITHTKPWTGCQTCKQRFTPCDEKRPVCGKCIRYHRICDYTLPSETKGPPPPKAIHGRLNTRPLSGPQPHTLPPTKYALATDAAVTTTSITPSIDPYSQSLLPLTPAKRAVLAFCERFILPFLTRPRPKRSLQAD